MEKPQQGSPGSAAAGGGKPAAPAPKPSPQPPPHEGASADARPPAPAAPPASPAPRPEPQRPAPERKPGSEDGRLALAPKLDELGPNPSRRVEPPARPKSSPTTPGSEERGAEARRLTPPSPTPSPQPQEEGVARAPGPSKPDLSVSPSTVARLGGGPGMAGYNEAEEGDITALNTKDGGVTARWGMRLQRQISNEWDPLVMRAVRERDPSGDTFFYKERSVVLTVVLDPSGNLRDVSVLRSSNIEFFDEAAVAAVRKAQPFEAPPPTFVVADGTARFPFKFVLFPARRSVFSVGQPER
jgi:TonB family protein